MSWAGFGTLPAFLRHSRTALVKRYVHLSPSHLSQFVEQVVPFGREVKQATPKTDMKEVEKSQGLALPKSETVTSTGKRDMTGGDACCVSR
jgi:hypothetical protein